MNTRGVAKKEASCPLCGSQKHVIVYPALSKQVFRAYAPSKSSKETGAIVRCCACHVVYKEQFPDKKMLKAGYEESIDEEYLALLRERRATFEGVMNVIERYRKKGRILDVGCAEGTLLDIARKRGWDVSGVEPNKHLVAWARKQYGLKIVQGTIGQRALKNNAYDVITLLDVIEHVAEPEKFLRRCHELLAPHGMIFISTPDFGSVWSRVMKRRWFYILSIHVFYFTKQTLSALLRRAGFEVVATQRYRLRTSLGYVAEKSKNYLGPIGNAFAWLVRALRLENKAVKYWLGQRMFISRIRR